MTREEYIDICPYDDSQFREKLSHLVKEPGFEHAVRYAMPDVNYYKFSKSLLGVSGQDAFQLRIIKPFLEGLEKKTTKSRQPPTSFPTPYRRMVCLKRLQFM